MSCDRIVNEDFLLEEIKKAKKLENKQEAERRTKILDSIMQLNWEYISCVIDYENELRNQKVREELCDRGIRFSKADKAEVSAKWDQYFSSHLSDEQKSQIFYHQYKWHVFSFGEAACKEGKAAKLAYNRTKRHDAYVFFQHVDEAWYIERVDLLTSADLSMELGFERKDFYLFDINGAWTYVDTHESGLCGPYFARKDMKKCPAEKDGEKNTCA